MLGICSQLSVEMNDSGGLIPELDSLGLACCYVIKGKMTDDRRRLAWPGTCRCTTIMH